MSANRAPLLPLLTRDVKDAGLICQHCSETLVPFDEIQPDLRADLGKWADLYAPVLSGERTPSQLAGDLFFVAHGVPFSSARSI